MEAVTEKKELKQEVRAENGSVLLLIVERKKKVVF